MGDQEAAPPSPVSRITAFGFDLGLSTATFAAAAGGLGLVGFGDVATAKRQEHLVVACAVVTIV
ncbi:hypothetical protein CSPAE12_07116 [Colletotrichum incanum]|nr:hypothetical protein CSPAE12_07116 [Colletotrichum incanum]